MKFSSILSLCLSTLALAAPTPTFQQKRATNSSASITDVPKTGYATENGGTTGGQGGTTTTVTTLKELTAAVSGDEAAIVIISGALNGSASVKVGSNKSIIGKDSSAVLTGIGFMVKNAKNVIIRNLAIKKVLAANGDAIGIQVSQNVWLDHLDLSSDKDHGKDYYDGLLDLTHAADYITISNVYFHDHYKGSLIGHSDNNGNEDTGHLRVTYHNNYFKNIGSRAPSLRFGTSHLFNNYYEGTSDGINVRKGAQVLVQNNVFVGSKKPLYSVDEGGAVASGNDFGAGANTVPAGTLSSVPYTVPTLIAADGVKSAVVGTAGNTLSF